MICRPCGNGHHRQCRDFNPYEGEEVPARYKSCPCQHHVPQDLTNYDITPEETTK